MKLICMSVWEVKNVVAGTATLEVSAYGRCPLAEVLLYMCN